MVRPAGVEPATIRVGGGDSIHLSYGRLSVWHARKELNPQPSALEAPALPIELPTYNLAETVGFEPTCRVNDAFLSREAFSATQARLHMRNDVVVLFGAAHLNRTGSYAFSARRTHQLYQSGNNLAETVRFELTSRVNDAFLSREAFSATQARLHMRNDVVVLFGAAHLNRTGSYAFSARRTHQLYQSGNNVAETVRFELTSRWVAPAACFPSRSLRPLGHISMNVLCSTGWARTSVPFQAL